MARDWTESELSQLRELVGKKLKRQEIVNLLGRTYKAVVDKVCDLKLAPKVNIWTDKNVAKLRELVAAGYGDHAVSQEMGISTMAVFQRRKKLGIRSSAWGRKWEPQDVEEMYSILAQGKTAQEIAVAMKRTYKSIIAKLREQGTPLGHSFWSAERTAKLEELLLSGLSKAQIAAALGTTRGSVAGRCNRLGLKIKGHALVRTPKRRVPRPKKVLRPYLFAIELTDLPPDQSPFQCTFGAMTESQCRWPLGDPQSPDFRFCGAVKFKKYSYCARHCAVAYRPAERKPASNAQARYWKVNNPNPRGARA